MARGKSALWVVGSVQPLTKIEENEEIRKLVQFCETNQKAVFRFPEQKDWKDMQLGKHLQTMLRREVRKQRKLNQNKNAKGQPWSSYLNSS
jgi:hypothetical protein